MFFKCKPVLLLILSNDQIWQRRVLVPLKNFELATIESLSKILGDTSYGLSGSEITKYLGECNIPDPGINSTKWKRLYDSLSQKQKYFFKFKKIRNFQKISRSQLWEHVDQVLINGSFRSFFLKLCRIFVRERTRRLEVTKTRLEQHNPQKCFCWTALTTH